MKLELIGTQRKVIDNWAHETTKYMVGDYTLLIKRMGACGENMATTVEVVYAGDSRMAPAVEVHNIYRRSMDDFEKEIVVHPVFCGDLSIDEFEKYMELQREALEVAKIIRTAIYMNGFDACKKEDE